MLVEKFNYVIQSQTLKMLNINTPYALAGHCVPREDLWRRSDQFKAIQMKLVYIYIYIYIKTDCAGQITVREVGYHEG